MKRSKLLVGVLALGIVLALTWALPGSFRSTPANAVFTPPANANWVAIDCDLVTAGIQDSCNYTEGQTADVGIIFGNQVGLNGNNAAQELAALNFDVLNTNSAVLAPTFPACGAGALNCNPDFEETAITGAGWACSPPPPSPDTGADGNPSTTQSRLSCFNASLDGNSVPDNSQVRMAVVHFQAQTAGQVNLSLALVSVGNDTSQALATANPDTDGTGAVAGTATITVAPAPLPPTAFEMYVDCSPSTAGIQLTCNPSAGPVSVDIVLKNNSGAPSQLGAWGFNLTANQLVLNPTVPACDASGLNCNPDTDPSNTGGWACSPPAPSPDVSADPNIADSFIGCFNGATNGQVLADGETQKLATVSYTGANGVSALTIHDGNAYDSNFTELISCNPVIGTEGNCFAANVTVGVVATATSTPAPATATPTRTNTPVPATNTPTATATRTSTPVPPTNTPTATRTNTPVPATNTSTPVPPTNTPTPTATRTNTPPPATNTSTPVPPTSTPTATRTNTPLPATATNTPVPPTSTPTATRTNTPLPATSTNTPVPPTNTPTNTVVPATATNTSVATATNTSIPPTNTPAATATATSTTVPATNTPIPPTATNTAVATATDTSVPPTATNTSVPPTATNTPQAATATPPAETAFELFVDCNTATAGIQSTCNPSAGPFSVDVYVKNNSGSATQLGAWGFNLVANQLVLNPTVPACDPAGLNCNPDADPSNTGTWACAPPAPSPDSLPADPNVADSFIGCFNGASDGQILVDGAMQKLATVSYTAANGTSSLTFHDGSLYDPSFTELLSCNPVIGNEGNCVVANVTVGAVATPTNTPAAPTSTPVPPTATPVPATATNTSVPATATNTPAGVPTSTSTPQPATPTVTSTLTGTATNTPVVEATATNTPEAPTATNTPAEGTPTVGTTATVGATKTVSVTKTVGTTPTVEVATHTPMPPTATNTVETPKTHTPVPPTITPVPPTSTHTPVTPTTTPGTATSTTVPKTHTPVSSTRTPDATSTRPATTSTRPASTVSPVSTVSGISNRPGGGAAGASALPNSGQGAGGATNDMMVGILSIMAAGIALYGVVVWRRRRG